MEQFGRVKTASRNISELKYRFSFIAYAKTMRCIVDDFKTMPVCDILDGFYVTWITINVGGQDGCGAIGDGGFDQGRVDIQGFLVDVYKYWLAAFPDDAAGGGYK